MATYQKDLTAFLKENNFNSTTNINLKLDA